jgi:predicted MPP superfamily phosphohydrolase
MRPDIDAELQRRLGRIHARQRLGLEAEHEAQVFRRGRHLFHIENWYSIHGLIRATLRVTGLYGRGHRNAERVELVRNRVVSPLLPPRFDGFTILHLSDLHLDLNPGAMRRVMALLPGLEYDLCVLTGDYRGRTYGPIEATLDALAELRAEIAGPIYGVLGNHDTVRLVPGLEAMGIRLLLNEHVAIERGEQRIHLAGIDDAHYFWADNIEKAASGIPHDEFSILLSHTPEIYRQAAHADFDLLLAGHTHGGQICLPGAVPITLDSRLPRRYGAGPWRYHTMTGYTSVGCGSSVVPVRFNCRPEITLHRLERAAVPQ